MPKLEGMSAKQTPAEAETHKLIDEKTKLAARFKSSVE